MARKIEPKQSGIYVITVNRGDKGDAFYIGQSVNIRIRLKQHVRGLMSKTSRCPPLQFAWNRYGEQAFKLKPILICHNDKNELAMYEQIVLDAFMSEYGEDRIYNVCKECVVSSLGVKRSAETRAKQSALKKGVAKSESHRHNMLHADRSSQAWADGRKRAADKIRGRKRNDAAAISVRLKKRNSDPEMIAKIQAAKSQITSIWHAKYEQAKAGFMLEFVGPPSPKAKKIGYNNGIPKVPGRKQWIDARRAEERALKSG